MRLSHVWRPIRQYAAYEDETVCPTPDSALPLDSKDGTTTPDFSDKAEKGDHFLVTFDDTPHLSARNWNSWYKIGVVAQLIMLTVQIAMASAISSIAADGQAEEFNVSPTVSRLSTAVFLAGFACGAIPFAPLSEALGRQVIYVSTLMISNLFEIGAALSPNIQTLIICRAISGFFGATPLSNAGGTLFDLYDPIYRSYAFPIYAAAGFLGPTVAPVIGGYLSMNVSWRWVYGICAITGCSISFFCFVFTPETLGDEILRHKAAVLRKRTGDERWHAPEEVVPLKELYVLALTKPFKIMGDPIVSILMVYLSVIYFLLFGWLSAYPVIFMEGHGLNLGENSLCFIPTHVGIVIAGGVGLLFGRRYERQTVESGQWPAPEQRLWPLLLGGMILPPGIFWLGFTSYPSISFWVPMMSGIPFGLASTLVFIGATQTLIDSYGKNASSSIASITFVRYWVSAGTALAAAPMFEEMRPWGACLLLGVVGIPLFCFGCWIYRVGPRLRQRSKYAVKSL